MTNQTPSLHPVRRLQDVHKETALIGVITDLLASLRNIAYDLDSDRSLKYVDIMLELIKLQQEAYAQGDTIMNEVVQKEGTE